MKPRYYITAAIPYANGEPHIGHAYEAIAADVLARFKRLDGFDVRFQTGMDEHGQKIEQTAKKNGLEPQALVDKVSAQFRALYDQLGISYDDFIRTTEPRHKKGAQEFWRRLKKDDVFLSKYSGWYSVRDEAYFDESELKDGEGGKKLAPSGAPVEWVEEESYFFRLSVYQDKLLRLYEENPSFIEPETRRNEIVSFVKSGLRDLSISRTTFNWGVSVPDAPKHVMYVWVDALSNYITALGYPDGQEMKNFWPADLHMIGKDITRFHAIYWPAFLMSAGIEVPKKVFGHGFIHSHGEKMSKSVGNVIDPYELVKTFGLDQTRYFFLRATPFGNDVDFSRERMTDTVNAELANNIGNLAQRTLSLIAKNCEGKVPQPNDYDPDDETLSAAIREALDLDTLRELMDKCEIHKVLEHIVEAASAANVYIDDQAPWALKKTDPIRMQTVLFVLFEQIRKIAIVLQPFVPAAAKKILDQLSVPDDKRSLEDIALQGLTVPPGTVLPPPEGVFPRYVEQPAT